MNGRSCGSAKGMGSKDNASQEERPKMNSWIKYSDRVGKEIIQTSQLLTISFYRLLVAFVHGLGADQAQQFRRTCPTKMWTWFGSKTLDTVMIFLKYVLKC